MLKPVELEIELFCRGLRIDVSTAPEDVPAARRTRAGLGSGLEMILPATRDIHVNVPVVEKFVEKSPFLLLWRDGEPTILDERSGDVYPVRIPPEPRWYSRRTSFDVPMHRVGVLQGNYVGIYLSGRCTFWTSEPSLACRFCTTGLNVGTVEEVRKRVEDVIEVARAAREESGSVFTHFNTGYHYEERPERASAHGLRQCEPYVRGVRERVGGFIGVQAVPVPRRSYHEYERLIDAGTDHFSFCYEFEDPEVFARVCPGKAAALGQQVFFDAMEHTAKRLGRGRVSGEIIAGIEPVEATMRGIDRIVDAGAFPTVCIFRPTEGSAMEAFPPPDPAAMREVFAYLYESCRRARLPVGILPIGVSLVVQPEEAADLVEPSLADRWYRLRNRLIRLMAAPYVARKLRPAAA